MQDKLAQIYNDNKNYKSFLLRYISPCVNYYPVYDLQDNPLFPRLKSLSFLKIQMCKVY